MTGPSVIVVGTGRSGTSSVARILHEKLEVCMGHHLKMQAPGGAYEDYLAHGLNRMVAANSPVCTVPASTMASAPTATLGSTFT